MLYVEKIAFKSKIYLPPIFSEAFSLQKPLLCKLLANRKSEGSTITGSWFYNSFIIMFKNAGSSVTLEACFILM